MRLTVKRALAVLIMCGFVPYQSSAQQEAQKSERSGAINRKAGKKIGGAQVGVVPRTLTADDGLAVIAAALDLRFHVRSNRDCSHLVHAIYDRAGFHYPYASSSDLFGGSNEFQRVTSPQVGDLVVWRGHLGIVVNPAQHTFFSALRSGLGIDSYDAPYWRERGQVRFYRYIKGSRRDAINAR
jgi:cell wall-associated NlpC family hydrolase